MIYLREIIKADIPSINLWRNDKDIVDQLGAVYRFINEETDLNWFDQYMKTRNNHVRLAICLKQNDQPIGLVNLTAIDWVNRNAEFSIMIGNPEYHSKGIGSTATSQIVNHAFDNLNLHRIYLTVLEQNTKAIEMYKKCGFVAEGLMKDCVFKSGSYKSMLMMALTKDSKNNA